MWGGQWGWGGSLAVDCVLPVLRCHRFPALCHEQRFCFVCLS